MKDIIVVETENGILIADEKQLERIKEGLEKLNKGIGGKIS
ncbi:hypothetical protein [Thermotoga sp. Ku-13t]|nr:hypothetical protein [Thermotoga sp. Ku-13t]